MNLKTIALSVIFSFSGTLAQASGTEPPRAPSHYNLIQGVGAQAYDPVSYFPEGGSQPLPGNANISSNYMGVIYYFASARNRETFRSSPSKYEPAYGGWCSYVMKDAVKDIVDPRFFIVIRNRLNLFHNENVRGAFAANIQNSRRLSDSGWKRISGENPPR